MSLASRVVSMVGAAALAAAALCATPDASAQATLITGLGGPAGFGPGTNCLSPNDDGSSNMIPVTTAFPMGLRFFTGTYNSMFVNTNGNITFNAALPVFTPNAFPVAMQPMIAPFWADVDIRSTRANGCSTIPIGTSPGYLGCGMERDNAVYWYLAANRIVVTWYNVGYYNCHNDRRMSFQLVLTSAPTVCDPMGGVGNFDVEFRYARCEWETGDASGGTAGFGGTQAQAGFDAGNMRDFVEIMGSRMAGISRHLCTGSNVMPAQPGIWRFAVRGGQVMCPDAGMPCTVMGAQGVCAAGRTACSGRTTTCQQITMASTEVCDGLDNNCNGMVDDGAMCPVGQMCLRGVCTGMCLEGSCDTGYSCVGGQCIETACVGMTCPTGQRCAGGHCVGACDGITCPLGQECRNGGCVDPCGMVTCAMGQVCDNGVCQAPCGSCRPCATGQSCRADGRCTESACAMVNCPAGQACRGGTCMDACTGAVCPPGQACMNGNCQTVTVDAGTPGDDAGGSTTDSGSSSGDGGSSGGDAGAGGDARSDARADARADGGTRIPSDAGCGCHAAGRSTSAPARTAGLALGALAALALRRRRRSA